MRKTKLICLIAAALSIVLTIAACRPLDASPHEKGDIYRFEDYENEDIFNIEKISLSAELAQKCDSYKFTYMSDGYAVKGYISIPSAPARTREPGKCVLFNRGGNRNTGMLDDSVTSKVCAACGRIVIASQYRGSQGSQGADRFGGDDLNDVIKLIDLCENHFSFVDMDDFCAAGVSRGGMMTYMAARRDNRIKRIIAVSAVSDLFESYEARDDMKTVLLETIGCSPQDNPSEYEKRSAIYWYDEIKVPVLMIHCRQDKQVSYSQAEALYEKLKDVTDCTFISHDDDAHGVLHAEDFTAINDWLN